MSIVSADEYEIVERQSTTPASGSEFNFAFFDSHLAFLTPSTLAHQYKFHQDIVHATENSPERDLMVMIKSDPKEITMAALLLGGHLIICSGMSVQEVADKFSPVASMFAHFETSADGDGPDLTLEDCWRALHHAKSLGWTNFYPSIDADDVEERTCIDMEEYLHYDDTANGAMHLVDPSRLLLFRCPADLPAGQAWLDVGGRRLFGAEHYAGVFADFDVRLVVRCGGARGGWDSEALRAAGMAVEELRVAPGGGAGMMAAVDRFLTLMRVVPGCVAVQCGGGDEDEEGGGRRAEADESESEADSDGEDGDGAMGEEDAARLLVAAHLIRGRGFGAAEALAWTRMAHPTAAGPAPGLLVLRALGGA
jgi:hypothetical protein